MSIKGPKEPGAPAGSGKLIKAYADVVYAWQHLEADLQAFRVFVDGRDGEEKMGARILACTLSAHLLIEKLLQMQITVTTEE